VNAEAYLWLIRHAPVVGQRGVIHDSDAPADISNAARIESLRSQLPPTRSVFCSPSRRTWDTALALGLTPVEEPAFREQNFGAWTGRTHSDIHNELGSAYKDFWRSPASNRPPGGESFLDQIARVATALSVLPRGNVVLVVHSGTVRAALAIALDASPESALRFVIDPWSLTRIDRLEEGGWRIVSVNRH
jgi:alpha-ribazole phosphatase